MKATPRWGVILMIGWMLAATAQAEPVNSRGKKEGGLQLSPAVADLLRQEMTALQKGVGELVPALAAGRWERVAAIGDEIGESYIMKQRLTPEQRRELKERLPLLFQEWDRAFHASAGALAEAAHRQDSEVAAFYFYRLNAACGECHARYAAGRFPGFGSDGGLKGEH